MKKHLFSSILCFTFIFCASAIFAQGTLNQRDQAFQDYKAHKDTISVRTWLNMVTLAEKLETLVLLDNVLLDSLLVGTPTNADLELRVSELSKIREQLITDNARLNQSNIDFNNQYKLFYVLFIVSSVLFLMVLGFFIYHFRKFKSVKHTTNAHGEDAKKLKQFYNEEVAKLKKEMINIQDEKELMHNNAIQMRSSFETLKEEKKSLETQLKEAKETDNFEEIRTNMEEMTQEVSKVMEEKRDLELEVAKLKQDLTNQMDHNKSIEEDLTNLFKRIKRD